MSLHNGKEQKEFQLQEYYARAFSGTSCGDDSIIPYIKSFEKVILWGASYQGKAIGKKLQEKGVSIDTYWDLRCEEIGECSGVKVIPPYSPVEDKENALVIVCIGNRVIHKRLISILNAKGYKNYIHGDFLYMGLLCPFNRETGVAAKRCASTMECRQVYCHRIKGILSSHMEKEEPIFLSSVTLVINQRCSLGCKYCTSYMNQYDKSQKIDFSLERICDDIDAFFDVVDLVGTITVMGGEPFMHPELSQIIEHLCQKTNFGLISIATSGTYPIQEAQLEGLHDPRVNVSFSNYTESISDSLKNLYYENIEKVRQSGVCYTAGEFSPEWIVPYTLCKKECSVEKMTSLYNRCEHYHQIKNGKVHPCDYANSIYSLGVADYPEDYLDLTQNVEREELKKQMRAYLNKPYYLSCGHHGEENRDGEMTSKAAVQGYVDMINGEGEGNENNQGMD